MRRGTFKQPTYEEKLEKAKTAQIRRQKVKMTESATKRVKTLQNGKSKAKKVSSKSLHTKVWKLCREIILSLYGDTCYSSGATGLSGSNLHLGHLLPKASLPLAYKYELTLLRPQSYNANINLGGDYSNYLDHWLQENKVTYQQWEDFRKHIKKSELHHGKDAQIYLQNKIAWLEDVLRICKENEGEDWLKDSYTRYMP